LLTEITEHKRLEAHLERLATAVDQAAESIVITDTDGAIQYVNPAFERTTGYSLDEVAGRLASFLKPPNESPLYREMWATISHGGGLRGGPVYTPKGGNYFLRAAPKIPFSPQSWHFI